MGLEWGDPLVLVVTWGQFLPLCWGSLRQVRPPMGAAHEAEAAALALDHALYQRGAHRLNRDVLGAREARGGAALSPLPHANNYEQLVLAGALLPPAIAPPSTAPPVWESQHTTSVPLWIWQVGRRGRHIGARYRGWGGRCMWRHGAQGGRFGCLSGPWGALGSVPVLWVGLGGPQAK